MGTRMVVIRHSALSISQESKVRRTATICSFTPPLQWAAKTAGHMIYELELNLLEESVHIDYVPGRQAVLPPYGVALPAGCSCTLEISTGEEYASLTEYVLRKGYASTDRGFKWDFKSIAASKLPEAVAIKPTSSSYGMMPGRSFPLLGRLWELGGDEPERGISRSI